MKQIEIIRREQGFAGVLGLLITIAIILILTSLYFTGGEPEPAETSDPASPGPGPATMGNALNTAKYAQLKTKLLEIRQAIQAFEALHGRRPASIEELKNEDGFEIRDLPEGHTYSYNPESGTVTIMRDGKTVCD